MFVDFTVIFKLQNSFLQLMSRGASWCGQGFRHEQRTLSSVGFWPSLCLRSSLVRFVHQLQKVGSSGRVFFQRFPVSFAQLGTKPYVLTVVRYIHAKVFVVTIVVGNSVVPSHLVLSKFPRIV